MKYKLNKELEHGYDVTCVTPSSFVTQILLAKFQMLVIVHLFHREQN
jgi:hypothetical protein